MSEQASPATSNTAVAPRKHLRRVNDYYRSRESRLGYATVLGGTKHFGYYRPGDNAWQLRQAMRRMEDYLAHTLALPRDSRVLDAGCGMGDVASRLAGVHWLNVTGIDILDFNVATARKRAERRRLADKLTFHEMDYTSLAFDDASFDGAYTMETLVHSDQVEVVLAELFRVLRPGGRLVHIEYSRLPEADCTPEESAVLREVNDAAAMPAWQRLDHGLLEQLLRQAGFQNVEAEDLTPRMLPMLRVFSLLARGPYAEMKRRGTPTRVVNAMSAVEFYKHQRCWKYQIYSATKPPA